MTERIDLERAILAEPSNRLLVGMLADCVQEEENLSRFCAVMYAARIRRAVVNTWQICEAHKLISQSSSRREWVLRCIRIFLELPEDADVNTSIIAGGRLPEVYGLNPPRRWRLSRTVGVIVGARWVRIASVSPSILIAGPDAPRLVAAYPDPIHPHHINDTDL